MCWAYLRMHEVLDGADLFLTWEEVDAFEIAVDLFLQSLQELHNTNNKRHIWKLRPKHHGLQHIAIVLRTVTRLNPKRMACHSEEDFMGVCKDIGKYVRGQQPIGVMHRFMQRYMLMLGLRWHRRKADASNS